MSARAATRFLLLAVALVWAVGGTRAADARIEDLEVVSGNGGLEVSYHLADAMNEDVLERLQAGIAVTYRHRVQWLSRRGMLLPDRELSNVVLVVTATYDSLTRTYQLSRSRTSRARGRDPATSAAEERRTTDSVETVLGWMTRLESVYLPEPDRLPAGTVQKVRVTSVFGRKLVLGMFPAKRSRSTEQALEP